MFAVNNFTLLYGQYSAGNVSCANGAVPLGLWVPWFQHLKPKDIGIVIPPRPNSPGGEVQ